MTFVLSTKIHHLVKFGDKMVNLVKRSSVDEYNHLRLTI